MPSRHASLDEDYLAVGAWFHHGPVSARRIYKRHLLANDGVQRPVLQTNAERRVNPG